MRVGEFDSALEAVQAAKDIRVLESAGAHLAYYIQATALANLGQVDDARAAAHCSLSYHPTNQTLDLLRNLGEEIGSEYTLTPADFTMCPEQTPTG